MTESAFWAQIARQFPDAKILQWDQGKRLVLKASEDLASHEIDCALDYLFRVLGDDPPGPIVIVTPHGIDWHIGKESTPLEYVLGQRVKQLEATLRAYHLPIPTDPIHP